MVRRVLRQIRDVASSYAPPEDEDLSQGAPEHPPVEYALALRTTTLRALEVECL